MNAKPMTKFRKLCQKKFHGVTHDAVAEMLIVSSPTVSRFMRGKQDSYRMAESMAALFGGRYAKLYAEIIEERNRQMRLNKQLAKERRNRALRAPISKHYVCLNEPVTETHKLPPIDFDNILLNTLPVVHPRPVFLGKPLWTIPAPMQAAA